MSAIWQVLYARTKEDIYMTKIRTIVQTVRMLKEQDPQTAITEKTLRRAVKNGEIPYRTAGTRVLLDYDRVCEYYGCLTTQ